MKLFFKYKKTVFLISFLLSTLISYSQDYIYIVSGTNYLAVNSGNSIVNQTATTLSNGAIWKKIPISTGSSDFYLFNPFTSRYLYSTTNNVSMGLATTTPNNNYVWRLSGSNIINVQNPTWFIYANTTTLAWFAGTTTTGITRSVQAVPKRIIHKEGVFYDGFLSNKMQKTHIIRKTIYASTGNVLLKVPPQKSGDPAPSSYFRWYNYDNDSLDNPSLILPVITTSNLGLNGKYYFSNTTLDAQRANYNYTSGGQRLVACDVSSYNDYVNGTTTVIEPTLSYRCIFDIRPATEIADKLKTLTSQGKYLEEKEVILPARNKLASTKQDPRVILELDLENYYGYTTATGSILGNPSSTGANWQITPTNNVTANRVGRFIYLNTQSATANTSVITVKLKTSDTGPYYNVARFTINISDEGPRDFSVITNTENRSLDYLNKNYVLISKLDFDTNTEIANINNNISNIPLNWDMSSYGFTSPELSLSGLKYTGGSNLVAQWNEYGFYKSANDGITTNYQWYNGGFSLRDRLRDVSSGTKNGYFMYVDASEEPGTIATLPIDPLCPGTRLYVSAAIASLTGSGKDSYPDVNLVFLGVDSNGKETELNRYTSGDIPSPTASPTPWYQLYFTFTFTQDDAGYTSYKVRLENNSSSTDGADYAIDDIRIYRSKPTVQANQITLPCGAEEAKIKIRVGFDKLLSSLGFLEAGASESGSMIEIKYKFIDSNKSVLTNYNYGTTVNPDYNYGKIYIYNKFSDMLALGVGEDAPMADGSMILAKTETEVLSGVTYRYITFQTPNNQVLIPNDTYYTVIANNAGVFGTDLCSMISDPFVIIPPSLTTVDGTTWTDKEGLCFGNEMTIGAKLRDRITHEPINCRFDWFIGSQSEFNLIQPSGISISQALTLYRDEYPNPTLGDFTLHAVQGDFTASAYNLLNTYLNSGRLFLNRSELTRIVRYGEFFIAVPIVATAETTPTTPVLQLCSEYIPIGGSEEVKNPAIEWNDNIVGAISLRMGISQFNDLKTNSSKTLTVPVYNFFNSDKTKQRDLKKAGDADVYLISTDDPSITVDSLAPIQKIATIDIINVTNSTSDVDFIRFNNFRNLNVKEGYNYKFEFHFNQVALTGETLACDGVTSLNIKIVPEYLTWTGNEGDNWNNDKNWIRSGQSDLYKNASHNSDSYTDYSLPYSHKGFVPLRFTKVVIPKADGITVNKSPWLYNLTGNPLNMDNSNYTTAIDKNANSATPYIEYDFAVKANGVNYDCESFYGNTADQIYFKPMSEMRNTNYLTYNQAHVEFELVSGRWYMLSSPLKGVYAGDMYIPTANGKQDTEAFSNITFNTSNYNRFNPAVYQRNWDKSSLKSFKTDNTFTDSYISSTWSQVFNEVDQEYQPGAGFSIKAHYGTDGSDKILMRLPKNDASYSYYSYNGAIIGNNTAINRTNNGKLAFEKPDNLLTYSLNNQTGSNNIFLAGNPFMSTIDMKAFFDGNPTLERKFWIFTNGGTATALVGTDGSVTTSGTTILSRYISPMQAFFIEKTDGSSATNITFTPGMTTSPVPSENQLRSSEIINNNQIIIEAINNNKSSFSTIRLSSKSKKEFISNEDVQLIIDSTFSEAPQIYTISDGKALLINSLNKPDSITLGFYNKFKDQTLIKIHSTVEDELYFIDKLNDSRTKIIDNTVLVVNGNLNNRFYITNKKVEVSESDEIYAICKNDGEITICSTKEKIKHVQIYSADGGHLITKFCNNENILNIRIKGESFYLIKVVTGTGTKTIKAICK